MSKPFSFPFFLLPLPLLVVIPSVKRQTDIDLLALFRSTTQKNHNLFAVFSKVNAVAGTEIDPALKNTSADTLDVGKVPKPNAVQRRSPLSAAPLDLSCRAFAKRADSAMVQILADIHHRFYGNIYCTIVKNLSGHKPYRSCQEAGFDFSSFAPLPLEHVPALKNSAARNRCYFFFPRLLPKMNVRLQVLHHFLELRDVQRLRSVADGFLRRGMHFHD